MTQVHCGGEELLELRIEDRLHVSFSIARLH
jgi:hypothetical protein